MNVAQLSFGLNIYNGKICPDCRIWKPFTDFHKEFSKADGHKWHCKLCSKKADSRHYQGNKPKIIDGIRKWQAANPDKIKIYRQKLAKRKPEIARVYGRTNYHLKNGNIKKPKYCSFCGQERKIQAHHENYSKPLEIIWLCASCHKNYHLSKEVNHEQRIGSKKG